MQKRCVKHLSLHSLFPCLNRPRGLDSFAVRHFVPYDSALGGYAPLSALLRDEHQGALLKSAELVLKDRDRSDVFVQYFVLKGEENDTFENMCTLMRRENLVSVGDLGDIRHTSAKGICAGFEFLGMDRIVRIL